LDADAERVEFGLGLGEVDAGEPIAGRIDGPLIHRQQPFGPAVFSVVGEAAPGPLLGGLYEIGAQRVAFDVAADGQKVIMLLDGKAFEAALIERAGAGGAVVGVVALGVGGGEQAHKVTELSIVIGIEDKVPVVGHEAIGNDADGDELVCALDDALHGEVVGVFAEDAGAANGAVEDVIDEAGGGKSQAAGHAGTKVNASWKSMTPDPLFYFVEINDS